MEAIDGFKLDLADTEKSLQEANAELATTTAEHTATVKYLADIEPGCTFIQTNYDGRKQAREAEKDALANAVSMLKATPIFQRSSRRRRRRPWASARRFARVTR